MVGIVYGINSFRNIIWKYFVYYTEKIVIIISYGQVKLQRLNGVLPQTLDCEKLVVNANYFTT